MTMDLLRHKKIATIIRGQDEPFTDADGRPHDWYGRCTIAILDEDRWIMALRSGLDHISWGTRDAIHILTSNDEGRTWGGLNQWFDGRPVTGFPFEDGRTHSETGLYRMPNGELILQCWRTEYSSGTRQFRSADEGRTWSLDHDQLHVADVAGADGRLALGTQNCFADPESPSTVFMAFQYFHCDGQSGALLAATENNGRSYHFRSWISPLAREKDHTGFAAFEPAVEYLGNRTIIAILRDNAARNCTWQTKSTDMGASFAPLSDISGQVGGGATGGMWQRARLFKESNPSFQVGNRMDYRVGEGRLWGFGVHSNGGAPGRTRVIGEAPSSVSSVTPSSVPKKVWKKPIPACSARRRRSPGPATETIARTLPAGSVNPAHIAKCPPAEPPMTTKPRSRSSGAIAGCPARRRTRPAATQSSPHAGHGAVSSKR